jgi:hypothetical protein
MLTHLLDTPEEIFQTMRKPCQSKTIIEKLTMPVSKYVQVLQSQLSDMRQSTEGMPGVTQYSYRLGHCQN